MKKILLTILIWVTSITIWKLLWNVYSADLYYEKSQNYLIKGDVEMARKLIDKAIQNNKFEPNYYRGRAKVNLVDTGYNNGLSSELEKERILNDLNKAVELNPDNLVTLRNLIPLYYFLAVDADDKYLLITRDYFNQVKTRFGHDAGVVVSLAKYEKKLGLTEDYQKSVGIIKILRPDLLEWYESIR